MYKVNKYLENMERGLDKSIKINEKEQ